MVVYFLNIVSIFHIFFAKTHLGVDFTNILRAAFTCADPKSAKKTVKLNSFIALLVSAHVKAACKTLVKLTLGEEDIVRGFWKESNFVFVSFIHFENSSDRSKYNVYQRFSLSLT